MVKRSKSLTNYSNVKKKYIKKNYSFNDYRELLKNSQKKNITFTVINPLFLYYNNKKNINTKKGNNNKEMNKIVKNKKIQLFTSRGNPTGFPLIK